MAGFHDPPWGLPPALANGRTWSAIRSGGGGQDRTGAAPTPRGSTPDRDESRKPALAGPTSSPLHAHSATSSLHADAHVPLFALCVTAVTAWAASAGTTSTSLVVPPRPSSIPSPEDGMPSCTLRTEHKTTPSGCAGSSCSSRDTALRHPTPRAGLGNVLRGSTATSRPSSLPNFASGTPAHRLAPFCTEYTTTPGGCAVSSYSKRRSPVPGPPMSLAGSDQVARDSTATSTTSSLSTGYLHHHLSCCGCAVSFSLGFLGWVVGGCWAAFSVVQFARVWGSVLQVFSPGTGAVEAMWDSFRSSVYPLGLVASRIRFVVLACL